MNTISADDKLVWDTPSGTKLTCIKSVVMEDDGQVAFSEGKTYKVESMHPIADPAFVRLTNDQGEPHTMDGGHLRTFFKRCL